MRLIIRLYSIILLGYTGYRTYDFMVNQLPTDQGTSQLIALLFLFTTEIGLLLWHEISIRYCTTDVQYTLAVSLTWVDFGASLGAGIADMILQQTFAENFQVPTLLAMLLIYGLPAAVGLNVAGVLFYLSNDADHQLERAKSQLQYELHRQAMKELAARKSAAAQQLKDRIAGNVMTEVLGGVLLEQKAKEESDSSIIAVTKQQQLEEEKKAKRAARRRARRAAAKTSLKKPVVIPKGDPLRDSDETLQSKPNGRSL